jgi:cardiolipin synthase
VYWATYAYVGELIKSGCKAYIYDKGFLHAKTIVVDGEVGSVGSANFDVRSFILNFEANAFIYDRKTATELRCWFQTALNDCEELTLDKWKSRPLSQRFMESATRILSPLL